jgi:hypothetical protein
MYQLIIICHATFNLNDFNFIEEITSCNERIENKVK